MPSSMDELILRASKEIVVKYIEIGMVSTSAFPNVFRTIYQAVDETVKGVAPEPVEEERNKGKKGK